MSKIKKQALSGILWNGMQLVVNQSFSFIIKLVLARLLFPEQFGLIGMAMVFTGLVQVFNDLGIGAALIQRKEEDLREAHFHTAFWTGVVWSIAMYLIVSFIIGPLASDFYNEPVLKSLIPVLGLGILSSPVNLVHKAQLTKKMNFKRMAIIDNTSNIIAGVMSLLLALMGAGVWSLAFNSVASIVIAMPLYFMATKWSPRFNFEKEAFKDVFGFGIYTTGTKIINYLINNIDYLLIGKLLSATALGSYTFAFVLTDTFRTKLMSVINNVFYPLYSKMQSDPVALKKYYLKVVNYNSIIVFPIMVFLFSLSDPIILILFGQKWAQSIEPVRLLSVSVMIHMMVNSNTALIRGIGKPELEMKLQLFKSFFFIPILYLGVVNYGILGAAYAIILNKIIAVIIAQYTFRKLINVKISTYEFFEAVKNPWLASIISYFFVYLLYNVLHLNYIIVTFLLFLIYGFSIWSLMGKELKEQYLQLKLLKKSIRV